MIRDPSDVAADEHKAIALYAVLARDPGDFIEMLDEASDEALKLLYLMLTTDHPDHTSSDRQLNNLGGSIVKGRLVKRLIPLPTPPETSNV